MPGTSALLWVWKILQPASSAESDVRLSPLLGECVDLAPHAIFVASEDPLYDEGIAFAAKLRLASVLVDLKIYPDVPHNFARNWELDATVKFWVDLQRVMETWLHGSSAHQSFETALQDHC
jgi:acetyl esterase/lipase